MDRAIPSNGHLQPGLSIRNGPLEEMEIDDDDRPPNGEVNGQVKGKRKSRQSLTNGKSYKEASSGSEDDAKPLVRFDSTMTTDYWANRGINRVNGVGLQMAKLRKPLTRILMIHRLCPRYKNPARHIRS